MPQIKYWNKQVIRSPASLITPFFSTHFFLWPHLFNLSLNSFGFEPLSFIVSRRLAMNELLAQQFALVGQHLTRLDITLGPVVPVPPPRGLGLGLGLQLPLASTASTPFLWPTCVRQAR